MHYLTAVIVPENRDEEEYLDTVLEPYSEHREVAPYRDSTPGEASETVAYLRSSEPGTYTEGMTDLEVLDRYDRGAWRPDASGELVRWSTYNPDGKWDWWVIGGRWENRMAQGDRERVRAANSRFSWPASYPMLPYVVITAGGLWQSQGHGQARLDDDAWRASIRVALSAPEAVGGRVIYLDLHC